MVCPEFNMTQEGVSSTKKSGNSCTNAHISVVPWYGALRKLAGPLNRWPCNFFVPISKVWAERVSREWWQWTISMSRADLATAVGTLNLLLFEYILAKKQYYNTVYRCKKLQWKAFIFQFILMWQSCMNSLGTCIIPISDTSPFVMKLSILTECPLWVHDDSLLHHVDHALSVQMPWHAIVNAEQAI